MSNVASDVQYQQHSYSLQTLFCVSTQMRRNLFHALIIIKPFHVSKKDLDLIYFIHQLVYRQGLPMRIGFLFYKDHYNVTKIYYDVAKDK